MSEVLFHRSLSSSAVPAAAAPRRFFPGGFAVVQDRHGNKLELTDGARLSLIGTWVALIVGLSGMVGTVWHFGESVSDSIYQAGVASAKREIAAAQESAARNEQTEEFRKYETETNDRLEALTRRIEVMEETQLKSRGLPLPPTQIPNQAKFHQKKQMEYRP
jgi:hypothetical protein